MLNLILRFYDVDQGAVLIDDQDVRGVTLRSLRGAIALVSQEVDLFDDTVRANIAYGRPDASDEAIVAAARAAAAHDFICALPRWLRHRDRTERREPLGRPAPASGHRPGDAQGRADPAPRRGDLGARQRGRAHRADGAAPPDARPHHGGDRASPVDRDGRRSDRGDRARPGRRDRAPTAPCSPAAAAMPASTSGSSPIRTRRRRRSRRSTRALPEPCRGGAGAGITARRARRCWPGSWRATSAWSTAAAAGSCATTRRPRSLIRGRRPFIGAFWHGRMLMIAAAWHACWPSSAWPRPLQPYVDQLRSPGWPADGAGDPPLRPRDRVRLDQAGAGEPAARRAPGASSRGRSRSSRPTARAARGCAPSPAWCAWRWQRACRSCRSPSPRPTSACSAAGTASRSPCRSRAACWRSARRSSSAATAIPRPAGSCSSSASTSSRCEADRALGLTPIEPAA